MSTRPLTLLTVFTATTALFAQAPTARVTSPPTPGAIALLALHADEPAARETLVKALGDRHAEVRAAAARVINTCGVQELVPALREALGAEKDPEAAYEEMDALAALGAPEDGDLLLGAAKRLGSSSGRALAEIFARTRGADAIPLYFAHRDAWHLSGPELDVFFAEAIRLDAAALDAALRTARETGDAAAWEAILVAARELHLAPDEALLLANLREGPADFRAATAWHLAMTWAFSPPPDPDVVRSTLAVAKAAPAPATRDLDAEIGMEMLSRVVGSQPIEREEWTRFLARAADHHLAWVDALHALFRRLTRAERTAIEDWFQRLYPDPSRRPRLPDPREGAPPRTPGGIRTVISGDAMRSVAGYPAGFVPGLLSETRCKPLPPDPVQLDAEAMADVVYDRSGRMRILALVIPDSVVDGCRDAARVLFATSRPPRGRFTLPDAPEKLLLFLHKGAVECADESSWEDFIGELTDHVGYAPQAEFRPPRLTGRWEPDYPEGLVSAKTEGRVIARLVTTRAECVTDVRFVSSDNIVLTHTALRALSKWRYEPATLNGKIVLSPVEVIVDFQLRR